MYLKRILLCTFSCTTSLILCSTNYDVKTTKSLITECTKLMRSLSQEKPTLDNPTWTDLFKVIALLEIRIASNKLPQEIVHAIQRSIESIKAVYTSQLQIHSHAIKSNK
jgi:hypothetical protein